MDSDSTEESWDIVLVAEYKPKSNFKSFFSNLNQLKYIWKFFVN